MTSKASESFSSRAEIAETEKTSSTLRTRESWKRTILFARMTKTIRRTTENIIKTNSGQWPVNLVLPVTPWQPPFLISHRNDASE